MTSPMQFSKVSATGQIELAPLIFISLRESLERNRRLFVGCKTGKDFAFRSERQVIELTPRAKVSPDISTNHS
jgi:hypothetical protein